MFAKWNSTHCAWVGIDLSKDILLQFLFCQCGGILWKADECCNPGVSDTDKLPLLFLSSCKTVVSVNLFVTLIDLSDSSCRAIWGCNTLHIWDPNCGSLLGKRWTRMSDSIRKTHIWTWKNIMTWNKKPVVKTAAHQVLFFASLLLNLNNMVQHGFLFLIKGLLVLFCLCGRNSYVACLGKDVKL